MYGQARNVLTGVELAVPRGEFVALIGASGCGKTTLLNVIAGLAPAAAGTVTIGGTPPVAGRGDICYVLARDALLQAQRDGQCRVRLELSGVGREERARRAATYIDKVGLAAASDLYPRGSPGHAPARLLARGLAVGRRVYSMGRAVQRLDPQTKLALHDQLLALWKRAAPPSAS